MLRALIMLCAISMGARALIAGDGVPGLHPGPSYCGVNRAIPMTVVPPDAPAGARLGVQLIDPASGDVLAERACAAGSVDLAALFPVLWTSRAPARVLYAQATFDGRRIGAPVVLEPLLPPARSIDGLTHEVMEAFRGRDQEMLVRLMALPDAELDRLRERVSTSPAQERPLSGLRVARLKLVILETSYGEIGLALAPHEAPNTCRRFVRLVEGGFYTQVAFHRVIASDPRGRPFILQAGDPTGTGAGGVGEWGDFEPSDIEHDFGVVSMARRPDDPNSVGSQFMICLSREGCAHLDGRYTAFARVTSGADAILAIASTPVGLADEDDPTSPRDRPLEPVVITRARTIPAPPHGEGPTPAPPPGPTER